MEPECHKKCGGCNTCVSLCICDGEFYCGRLQEKQDNVQPLDMDLLDVFLDSWSNGNAPEWLRTKVKKCLSKEKG